MITSPYVVDHSLITSCILSAGDHKYGAVHFGPFHNACAIVAGNHHDGYLSQSTNASTPRLTMKHAELLPAQPEAYFYHVPGESDYPIVQMFDLWHDPLSLPFAWTWLEQDDVSSCVALVEHAPSVSSCSKVCRLSNYRTAVMPCPLLPAESNPVYLGNDTHVYNQSINPAVNILSPSAVDTLALSSLISSSQIVVLPQEGCDITYQGATTKRQRTLSFATDSPLESTVLSVSLDNSDEFDDGWVHHSAPTGLSPQNARSARDAAEETAAGR
ncbi:hypothetical protein KCU89_g28, partial [Aureobasidium melanogenum]